MIGQVSFKSELYELIMDHIDDEEIAEDIADDIYKLVQQKLDQL